LLVILLDNSIKFTTENGKILVILRKRGHQAVIIVEDTGTGIDAKDLPHIFDRFYRGDKTRSRGDGGTGLGLAIAKWIVEKHGGTIVAASKHGKGTTMTIQMPIVHKR
jgi:two-component system, OmpR family, sensor histidine kinase CiaH